MKFGTFGKDTQIEIITTSDPFLLQNTINAWLKGHKDNIIVNYP